MITPNTKMCQSEDVVLKDAPLKPYQDDLFKRAKLETAPMSAPVRPGATQFISIKSRGQQC